MNNSIQSLVAGRTSGEPVLPRRARARFSGWQSAGDALRVAAPRPAAPAAARAKRPPTPGAPAIAMEWIELFIRNEKILSPDSEISRNVHTVL